MALPVVFVLFVVLRAMDRVFNQRGSDRMANYQIKYIGIFWPIGVQVMVYAMCVGYVAYQRRGPDRGRYTWRFFHPRLLPAYSPIV